MLDKTKEPWPCALYYPHDLTDIFAMYGCDADGIMRVHEGQQFIDWADVMKNRRADDGND